MRGRRWAAAAIGLVSLACGSRTALLVDDAESMPFVGPSPVTDASFDDATMSDAAPDALPPIDATPRPDVDRSDCPDADATLIYVVTVAGELLAYNPPTGSFRSITHLTCPAPMGSTPFSMAVDRKGIAYVVYSPDGALYRVSTATGACIATAYQPGQHNFLTFGMGFTSLMGGPDETLFVAADMGTAPSQLGTIDLNGFVVNVVAPFQPALTQAELTGTGDGRLYAFYEKAQGGSAIGEVDPTTAGVIAETPFPQVQQGQAWAFGFWGGDFYMFTSPDGAGSTVTRFRPSEGSTTDVASYPTRIVGAGVSTCAPER
jgi:hypothetical protein